MSQLRDRQWGGAAPWRSAHRARDRFPYSFYNIHTAPRWFRLPERHVLNIVKHAAY
jgi:hypothetical protein